MSFRAHEIVAEEDRVMARYTLSGTHRGVQKLPFVHGGFLTGVAPTGLRFSVQHVHLFRFENGLSVQHDAVQDNLAMARQLGLEVAASRKSWSPVHAPVRPFERPERDLGGETRSLRRVVAVVAADLALFARLFTWAQAA